MNKKHFWNWSQNGDENILHLNGTIAEESWFEDDITPALFRAELEKCSAPITVYINSPGGDCVAAAQIYTMLMDYPYDVTVKIDGIAASAASVIAMGDHTDMEKAIAMLDSVKESIINAYEIKTGISRKELSAMMDSETWMDANKAVELGFADGILERETQTMNTSAPVLFSQRKADAALVNRMMRDAVPVQPYYDRLAKLK